MQATAKGQSRSSLRSYRDLDVWQKSMELVVSCYELSERFPTSETYGLGAAISIPANIAEGQGRNHTKEFINHLSMAYGSLMEVETHLQIAARLNYVDSLQLGKLLSQCAETGRMLNGLMMALNRKLATDH